MLNTQGRPTAPGTADTATHETFTGNRALQIEEALIFEIGRPEVSGVDLPEAEPVASRLGGLARPAAPDLPGLSEPEMVRHYVRLSRQNFAIDAGLYPLGSCTMKHNPRLNEKLVRLPGLADIHPLQPAATVKGALKLMAELGDWLMRLTGMAAVALSPKAGAHGELAGMMAIKAAIRARQAKEGGPTRDVVLVPASAHGTNPATAALIGFKIREIPARPDGTVGVADVKAALGPDVAAIMLTNPNTCGIFEPEVEAIAAAVHEAGAYFYGDGANFNAIVGKVRPGDLGIDAMHINLHKTFSTPHGGGGPGAGPVVLSERLAAFAPLPFLRAGADGPELVERTDELAAGETPFGRMVAFHGNMGMFVRALGHILSHGGDGLRQASEDAVLAANYLRALLADVMTVSFPDHPSMHEALFDDRFLEGTGVTTLDFAKAMIDEGFHPMTMYFPLVVHGAMLIEPTESESKASLDLFAATLRDLVFAAKAGDTARFTGAPYHAPRRRLDETRAAREPKLAWKG
jgi:glycine dehydrogenase subunit 2